MRFVKHRRLGEIRVIISLVRKEAGPMKDQLLLIYNPISGQHQIKDGLADVVDSLLEKWDVTIRPTSHSGHAGEIIKAEGDRYSIVVAAGGDGTIHEVVNGLMTRDHPPVLGILPGGTANDIARTLQIPLQVMDACQFLKEEKPVQIDLGCFGGEYFVNFLGLGLISTVSDQVKNDTKTHLGHFTYYVKSLQYLHEEQPFRLIIKTDAGQIEEDAVMVYVANGQSLAGIELFKNNQLDNGLFQIVIVRNIGLSGLVSAAASYFRNEPIEHEAFRLLKASSLTIACDPPQKLDADGEKMGETPVHIVAAPRKLSVIGKLS
jgi:diacylglycerol kinase (ATP)